MEKMEIAQKGLIAVNTLNNVITLIQTIDINDIQGLNEDMVLQIKEYQDNILKWVEKGVLK